MRTLLLGLSAIATTLATAGSVSAQDGRVRPDANRVATLAAQVLQRAAERDDCNGAVVMMRDGQIVYEGAVGLALPRRQPSPGPPPPS